MHLLWILELNYFYTTWINMFGDCPDISTWIWGKGNYFTWRRGICDVGGGEEEVRLQCRIFWQCIAVRSSHSHSSKAEMKSQEQRVNIKLCLSLIETIHMLQQEHATFLSRSTFCSAREQNVLRSTFQTQ